MTITVVSWILSYILIKTLQVLSTAFIPIKFKL